MNFRKLGLVFLVIVLSICLFAPVADAKKKKKGKSKSKKTSLSKGISDHVFQLGLDLGGNIFSFVPFGDITVEKGTSDEDKTKFSGTGGFGFLIGLHGHVNFSGWIIRGEFAYANQPGQGKYKIDGQNKDFDYVMNDVKLGVGFGKTLIKHRVVHPYFLVALDYHYLTFRNEDEDESAKGSGLGLAPMIGVDVKFLKTFFAGGGARMDMIYTVNPLEIKDSEVTMGYFPISLFINGGYLF